MSSYPPHQPPAPMAALPSGPVGGTPRQWEARVRRLARDGRPRAEILSMMTQANWPADQAQALIDRVASRERWAAIGTMIGTGVVGLLGAVILASELGSRRTEIHGGEVAFIVFGVVGFIYGLVRLTKLRA